MDLLVITPSRGRPERLFEMVEAVNATKRIDTRVLVLLDDDDPTREAYSSLPFPPSHTVHATYWTGPRQSLADWTNDAARAYANNESPPRYLASLGDDHIPRTPGWDAQLVTAIEAMNGPGWAYGDDLYQGGRIPTAWVQSTELVGALGWMALPGCEHLCIDSAVLDLGRATGRIAYVPDVVIEHMHPAAGKAAEDATYAEGNSPIRNLLDGNAYRRWKAHELERDAATVKALTYAHLEA